MTSQKNQKKKEDTRKIQVYICIENSSHAGQKDLILL